MVIPLKERRFHSMSDNRLLIGCCKTAALRDLYNAAKPSDKTITLDEAKMIFEQSKGVIDSVYGKTLCVDLSDIYFDPTEYDKLNGEGLSKKVINNLWHRLLFGDPQTITFIGGKQND